MRDVIFGPIKVDGVNAVNAYAEHITKLEANDLRLRFGSAIKPEHAVKWVRSLDFNDTKKQHVIWAMITEGELISICHIVIENNEAEIALSTLPDYRRHGYSKQLLDTAISYLRNRNIRNLSMVCLSENHAVQQLAKKAGLITWTWDGDSVASMKLPWPDISTVTKETCANALTLWDKQIRYSTNIWYDLLGKSK